MRKEKGFSLIETLVVVGVFTVITGAVFMLLNVFQQRYKMESEVLDAFQGARMAVDQINRDVHSAGYPPGNALASDALAAGSVNVTAAAFAWSASDGYPTATCNVGTCTVPGDYDLIVELDADPENFNGVEWVRYRLNGTTLERAVVSKTIGGDPVSATGAAFVPYVENVINNPGATIINRVRASYSSMFPGGNAVPMFRYRIEPGAPNTPPNIREVDITLIVMAANPDPKTGQLRVVTLEARARRINPAQ
jgi:prepilin-type N-terminal cleavage/methylation domain-containing protein